MKRGVNKWKKESIKNEETRKERQKREKNVCIHTGEKRKVKKEGKNNGKEIEAKAWNKNEKEKNKKTKERKIE